MGKGGGALSAWMKEFVTLVFVQTIQAFIFAIIISIILFGLGSNQGEVTDITADDNNAALGLMSVFALLSVFKVEDMVKKIFGISDTKASHRNALSSLAKTAVAAKLGSKVLNNAGKFFGGIRTANQAGQDRRKLKKRLEEDMKDEGFTRNQKGELVRTSRNKSGSGAAGASSKADKSGGTGNANAKVPSGEISDASYRRIKKSVREYEDKLAEINKARNEGIKDIFSSLAESAGALGGGITGGIILGSDGDIDDMLRGVVGGAGAGDIVGKNIVTAGDKAINFAKRNYNREKGVSNKEIRRAIDQYKTALEKTGRSGEVTVEELD